MPEYNSMARTSLCQGLHPHLGFIWLIDPWLAKRVQMCPKSRAIIIDHMTCHTACMTGYTLGGQGTIVLQLQKGRKSILPMDIYIVVVWVQLCFNEFWLFESCHWLAEESLGATWPMTVIGPVLGIIYKDMENTKWVQLCFNGSFAFFLPLSPFPETYKGRP